MSTDSNLIKLVIDERVKGKSYYEIEREHGIPALDAMQYVKEALSSTSIEDEWEQRGIQMLRMERIIEHLWLGVENGNFKHAEVMLRAIEQLTTLLNATKASMKEVKSVLTDEQANLIYLVLSQNNSLMLEFIKEQLKPNKTQTKVLESWPTVAAENATGAIESVIYAEEMDE